MWRSTSASVIVADRPFNRQAVVVGKVELGPHLDVEFVLEVPFVRKLDRFDVEVGLVDRVELLVRRKLLHAFQEHPLLDFGRQLGAEAFFDQLLRHMAGPEPGDGDRGRLFFDGVLVEAVDLRPRNADVHVLLAGAGLLDLDGELHLGLFSRGFLDLCFAARPGLFVRCCHSRILGSCALKKSG